MVDTTAFRDAMAMLGGAVSIVTTAGQEGKVGMTASAVYSVTDSPATVLVCINRSAWAHRQFMQNGILCVNVLGVGHQAKPSYRDGGAIFDPHLARACDRFTCA